MTLKEVQDWTRHELFELLKQASAIIIALTAVGGFVLTFWSYFGLPTLVSMARHTEDVQSLKADTGKKLNQLMRMVLSNSINVLQGRVTVIHARIHDMEDARLIHQRSLNFQEMSDDDKAIAKRRVASLDDELRWTKERLVLVYREMQGLRNAITRIPYDPTFRDLEDVPATSGDDDGPINPDIR